jgi:hypothetical protein
VATSTHSRPLGVGEVLDAAFQLYRNQFGTLVKLVTLAVAPVVLLDIVVRAATTENAFDLTADEVLYTDEGTYLAGQFVSGLLNIVAAMLAVALAFRVLSAGYRGESESGGDSLRFAMSRILPVLWITLLSSVAAMAGLLLLVVGAIWLLVAFSVSIPVLMVEDRRGTKALGRSFRLVQGRWWATFGALLVAYLVLIVVSALLGALLAGAVFSGVENQVVGAMVMAAINILSAAVATPLIAAVATVIYFDLRLRKEGADMRGQDRTAPAASGWESQPAAAPGWEPPPSGEGAGGFLPPEPPRPAEAPERPDPPRR